MLPFGRNRYGPKIGGLCPFGEGQRGPHITQSPGPRPSSIPSGILAAINTGRKWGAPSPFWGGGAGSPSNTKSPRLRPTYLHVKYQIHPSSRLAAINMGRKFVAEAPSPFWGGGAGSPSITKSPGPRRTSVPIGTLIHAAIFTQQISAENWGAVPLWGV